MDDPYATIRKLIAEWDLAHGGGNLARIIPIEFSNLEAMDFNYDWLVDRWLPVGAHMHLFAAPKTGKSLLMLWIAVSLSIGKDPFTGEPKSRRRIAYIDNEMTLKELRDRLYDMNAPFADLDEWLAYYFYPTLAPMDTATGGTETLELVQQSKSELVIIDTLSRVVKGEENSNDTYRNFYNHTGRLLKANDIAMIRIDHTGHDPKRSRGASAKSDDVDLVYGLEKRVDNNNVAGFRLTRTHARIGNVSERIDLTLSEYPVTIRSTTARMWTDGAIRKARELDELDIPYGISQRETIRVLKDRGVSVGATAILAEAIRLRLERQPFREFGL